MPMNSDTASSSSGLISNYRAPIPGIVTKYMDNLTKGGFLDLPSFNELFGSYKDVANRNADQQAAAVTESLGSMGGGRVSSSVLNKVGQVRKDTALDLASKAADYQTQLRGQQFKEVAGVGNLLYGANEAAMSRLWSDFLRRTSPPPLLGDASSLATSYGLPATIVA